RRHGGACSGADGADDGGRRHRHADHRIHLDPSGHQNRGLTMLLPVLAFLFASLLVAAAAMAFSSGGSTIERRLGEIAVGGGVEVNDNAAYQKAVAEALKRSGNPAPRSSSELGKLQKRLLAAGYRSHESLFVFFGIRLACALGLFVLMISGLFVAPNLFTALVACALGYLLPGMALARMAKKRQHKIRLGLPDALDL